MVLILQEYGGTKGQDEGEKVKCRKAGNKIVLGDFWGRVGCVSGRE
jgi:hypothetical protein